jgi:hypothetical protein
MSLMTDDSPAVPPLITVLDLFRDYQSQTLESVVEQLNVSEAAAMAALERLEQSDVLVRSRGGTGTPVWKRHAGATSRLLADPTSPS